MTVNLTNPIFTDEDKARAYFEEIRWPNGVTCPHCGNANSARIYSIAANAAKKIRVGLREVPGLPRTIHRPHWRRHGKQPCPAD